jgi:hypothetical protein
MEPESEEESEATESVSLLMPGKGAGSNASEVLQMSNILSMLATSLSENDAPLLLRGFFDAAKSRGTTLQMEPNMSVVQDLTSMGFDDFLARKACVATMNRGLEEALEWMEKNPSEASELGTSSLQSDSPTKSRSRVRWRSEDPRTGQWLDYDEVVADSLEKQFQSGNRMGEIFLADRYFTIDFTPGAMEQINGLGYARSIERVAPLEILAEDGQTLTSSDGLLQLETIEDIDDITSDGAKLSGPTAQIEAPTQVAMHSEEVISLPITDETRPSLAEEEAILEKGLESASHDSCTPMENDELYSQVEVLPTENFAKPEIGSVDAPVVKTETCKLQASSQIEMHSEAAFKISPEAGLERGPSDLISAEKPMPDDMSESATCETEVHPYARVRSVSLKPLPLEPPMLTRLSSAPARIEGYLPDIDANKRVHIECK